MPQYIHELEDWPAFRYDRAALADSLSRLRHRQGSLVGRMSALGIGEQQEATLTALTQEVQKSSEIEGESLDTGSIRSSLARRLGIDIGALLPEDRHVQGMVEMMLDATQQSERSLTVERLFAWHAALFPTGQSGMQRIRVGAWRTDANGPMQVVSGGIGHEKVHFEAPAAQRLEKEIEVFLAWFNREEGSDQVIKAAIAHLWFVTIHPFDDGNGRIARAIADLMLARSEGTPQRYYSMSAQIRRQRKAYYEILEKTQKGGVDITPWLAWFLACLESAIAEADLLLSSVLKKAEFWRKHRDTAMNDRQRVQINRLFDGFEGKLTTAKWAKIAKCSHDTALRDIQDLIGKGILVQDGARGRSTGYALANLNKLVGSASPRPDPTRFLLGKNTS